MKQQSQEILSRTKELKNLSKETSRKLEQDGLSITFIPKEQLFTYNIKSMIETVEALVRNEPSERLKIRLGKDIPDSYLNLKKVESTPQGKSNAESLRKIKEIIQFIEENYAKI